MVWPLAAPGMQDASETGPGGANEAWLFGEAFESLGRSREQGLGRQPRMGAAKRSQGFWHGEGEQAVRPGQLLIELAVPPLRRFMRLTLRTVPMATGMSDMMM